MAENTPEDLRAQVELQRELNGILESRRGIERDILNDVRTNANVIKDQLSSIKFQAIEKAQLQKINNSLVDIAQKSYSTTQSELGLQERINENLKSQERISKNILDLESLAGSFKGDNNKLNQSVTDSLEEQERLSVKLVQNLKELQETSESIKGDKGVKLFQSVEDVMKAIPGLRKYSESASIASEASRKQSTLNLENVKKISKQEGISSKAAQIRLKAGGKYTSAMSAGFKSLAPVISKAFGPLALLGLAVKVVKEIFDEMKAASQMTANFSRNMMMSREAARGLRDATFDMAKSYNAVAMGQEGVTLSQKEYLGALESINSTLGFQLNLTQDFGEQTAQNVGTVAMLTKQMGLSSHASTDLFLGAEKSHKSLEAYTKELMGTVALESARSGLQVNMKETIETATKVSGVLKSNFKGSYTEIAKSVFQAKLLGLTLEQVHGTTSSLLNFESSIGAELNAELLLGKQLNLEGARYAALMGDTEELMKEITSQGITKYEFDKMNVIQQKAYAEAVGLSADELADMYQTQAYNQTLQKNHAKMMLDLKKNGHLLDIKGNKITNLSLEELKKAANAGMLNAKDAIALLGKEQYLALQSQSAQEKWNDALTQAKDIFRELIDGGTLDKLAAGLKNMTNSWLFDSVSNKKSRDEQDEMYENNKGKLKDAGISPLDYRNTMMKANYKKGAFGLSSEALLMNFEIENARKKLKEFESKLNPSKDITSKPKEIVEDFIMRPGQKPIKYQEDDIIIGGTNLLGNKPSTPQPPTQPDNTQTLKLLERIANTLEKGGDVHLDGVKVGKTLVKSVSSLG